MRYRWTAAPGLQCISIYGEDYGDSEAITLRKYLGNGGEEGLLNKVVRKRAWLGMDSEVWDLTSELDLLNWKRFEEMPFGEVKNETIC